MATISKHSSRFKYKSFLKNKSFSIPYNNDPELIQQLHELLPEPRNFNIYIYFAPSPKIAMAGRKFPLRGKYLNKNNTFNEKKFDKELRTSLKLAKKFNFRTNVLLNNILLGLPHFNKDLKKQIPLIQNYLESLNASGYLDRVTIGNPYLLELINWARLPNVEIKTSVNLQIKDSKSIDLLNNISRTWLESDISAIEIQKDLLRNLKELSKIRSRVNKKIKLSIIVNEGCLTGCPYQIAHQVHSFSFPDDGYSEADDLNFGIAKCKYITNQEPWRILDANWVLPAQLKKLAPYIDEFKLTDRYSSTKNIIDVVRAYVYDVYDKENINGLISLLSMEKFDLPEKALPHNFFDKVMAANKPPDTFFKKIWEKIKKLNKSKNICAHIRIKGKTKIGLHEYIGNN